MVPNTHAAVIAADGAEPVQLTDEPGQSWIGGWSPDGEEIVFAGLRNGAWNVWWVSHTTSETKRLTD